MEIQGSQGLGWEGANFVSEELNNVRGWLWGKAISIYGGSWEVQNNIISIFSVSPRPHRRANSTWQL